jgi:hypothetical protein
VPLIHQTLYQLSFRTADNITWWKDIEFWDAGVLRATIWTKDDKHEDKMVLKGRIDSGLLVFKKAKRFGIHSAVYAIRGSELVKKWGTNGQVLRFIWEHD